MNAPNAAPQTKPPAAGGISPTRAVERSDSPANPETPPAYGGDVTSGEIRADIARTRTEMDGTLDQLGEWLRPSNLIEEALGFAAGWVSSGLSSASARLKAACSTETPLQDVYEERRLANGTRVPVRREGVVLQRDAGSDGLGDLSRAAAKLAGSLGETIR